MGRWSASSARRRYASTSGNSGTGPDATVAPMPPEKLHWADLYKEVVTSGLCTGCAACIVVCPHDVLNYNDGDGVYRPWKVEADGGPTDCTHGVKGCTMCTRACPRFRTWETEIDTFMFGRERTAEEDAGVVGDIL